MTVGVHYVFRDGSNHDEIYRKQANMLNVDASRIIFHPVTNQFDAPWKIM